MNLNEAKVIGILDKNSKTRDEHLKRNYGKYFQYTENLVPAIGEVYNIDYNRPLYSITDNQPLLEYSHNGNQAYGQLINRKYFNKNREKDIYSVKELNFDQIQAWGGDYTDYISYLDEVLGEDVYSRHVRYINDFLSGQYMENALRQTEVGVVRNINVPIAKQGIITTNPNNLKGIDTKLGTITNYMYSTLLYNGAIFNSDRKSQDKYITRSLINQYGNNLSNVSKLGDMLRVGVGDYELREDLGAGAHIIHSFKDAVGDLNIHWMSKNVENAKKYLEEYNKGFTGYELGKDGYVKYYEDNNGSVIIDMSGFNFQSNFVSIYKSNSDKTYDIYNENWEDAPSIEDDVAWEHYEALDGNLLDSKSILTKTAKLFNEHKINTLIGRFHTTQENDAEQEFIDTAKSTYGNSHGRNLLTRDAQDSKKSNSTHGYDNPYCRTWTYHHQYNQVKKLIRPFITTDDNGEETVMSIESVQMTNGKYRSRDKEGKLVGAKYLGDNTVLNKNGFVNICPSGDQSVTNTTNYGETNKNVGTRIEKCMFSIENLAWKDVPKFTKENYISKEQTGPNGGRIMWFPPYDLSFSENVNVAWNESSFIGRGEKVYTYTNTDRTGTLSFTLLIDHPSIVNTFSRLNDGDISSDIDSDILRYFAGCEIPEIKEEESNEDETIKDVETGIEEIKRTEKFSFYVYFPNNFSGIVSDKSGKNIKDRYDDWWKYILVGNNCEFYNSNNEFGSQYDAWVGYETTPGVGISKYYDVTSIEDRIREKWIGVSKFWWEGSGNDHIGEYGALTENDAEEVSKTGEGKWCYKYRVDNDLRQKLRAEASFIDNESNQLNIKIQKGTDAKYSFGEIIAALIMAKKIDTNEIDSNELLNFLLENGCSSESVNKLSEDFKTDGLKIDSIEIYGSADSNDKKNSGMLAKRRAESIKNLFINDISSIEINNENISIKSQTSQSNPSKSANDKENKLQRYAFVTVEYTLPGTRQAYSSMSEEATNKQEMTYEEEIQDEEKFNEWYSNLKEYASIINEYDIIFDNEDFELKYNTFDSEIKEWCKENEIDYTDDSQWQSASVWNQKVVNPLVEKYGLVYFMPALCIGGDISTDLNCNFLEHLNNGGIWVPSEFQDSYDFKIESARANVIKTQIEKNSSEHNIEIIESELENTGLTIEERERLEKELKQEQLRFNKADKENSDAVREYNKLSGETPINIDLTKTEIYFEKLFESNPEFSIDNFCGESSVCTSTTYTLHETAITCSWEYFPYSGYNTELQCEDCSGILSYNLLLLEYLTIRQLINNINEGFEYCCEYLFKNDGDYNRLKNLLYINYLLSLIDNKDLQTEDIVNFISNFNNQYINDEIYVSRVYNIKQKYDIWETDETEENWNNFITEVNLLKSYILLKIDEIIEEVANIANEDYNNAKKNAEKVAKEKEAQRLKKKYKSECDTLEAIKDSVDKKKDQFLYSVFMGSGYTRYETEGEYFEKLNIEHPLIFKSIKDKFKYFNPAFHSMSPEGFNARLNFLHQCTRQGHTYEAKAKNGITTAHNLSFGRMPVCVLRIGDFINTRIIINNVNINYDNGGMQWDLNPEGIGVQPMYAKVNLGITIIGGQSLNGPISRLQNAVSFDYYANTGVYDDRADRIHRDVDGSVVYDYVFNINPHTSHDSQYTLYQTGVSQAEKANSDTIDMIKANKKEYDDANKQLNDYNLSEGNDQCKK